MFTINFKFISLYFLILLLLSTNTTGFDLYFHAISTSEFRLIDAYNPAWVVSDHPFPRYLLLQYIFWTITFFGILPLYPVVGLFYALAINKIITIKFKYSIIKYLIIILAVFNIVFSSAIGISMLTIGLGYLIVRNNEGKLGYYLIIIGSLLHPVGIMVGLVLLLLLRKFSFALIACTLLYTAYLIASISPDTLVQDQRTFNFLDIFDNTSPINSRVLSKLSVEVFGLVSLLAATILLFLFGKIRQFKWLINVLGGTLSTLGTNFIIFILLVTAIVKSYPAHLSTGGPLAVLTLQHTHLPTETINIIASGWISPLLLDDSVKLNQYLYRGDQ